MSPRVLVTGVVLLALVIALVATVLWLSVSGKRAVREKVAPPPAAAEPGQAAPVLQSEQVSQAERAEPVTTPADSPATPAAEVKEIDPAPPAQTPAEPAPAEVHSELESVGTVIRDYRNALGGNPVGTNAEITSALLGENPKQTSFEVPTGSSVNAQGEMIDRWSTPYFFHQISGTQMEIRSAGPDRKMWSSDDVVGR